MGRTLKTVTTMKKIMNIFVFVAVAAMALVSCNKEIENPTSQDGEYVYTFKLSNETKATLGEECVEWENGDQIGVYTDGQNGVSYNRDGNITLGSPVTFKISSNYALVTGDMVHCYYPYVNSNSQDPRTVELSIPTSQTEKNQMPMVSLPYAVTKDLAAQTNSEKSEGEIRFANLGSVIEFHVYSTTEAYQTELVKSVTFNADQAIAGNFTFDMTAVDYSDEKTLAISGYEATSVVSTISTSTKVSADKNAATVVKMVVAPGTYTGEVVVTTDKATYTFPISTQFKRSTVKPLGLNLRAEVREAEPEEVVWDLTKASYESASTEKVVWSSEFVNLTLEKGASSTSANNHLADEHSRVYKNQIMTFDPLGKYQIESIEFAVVSGYVDAFAKATWVNGEPVTSGNTVVVTPTDGHAKVSATLGEATRFTSITVYYSYDENYVLPTVESIAADGQTSELMQGSEFVFGGTVTATYSNGETADVTSAANFSGYDMSASGEQTVEVSYTEGEKTVKTTYQLTVLPADADVTDKLNLAFTGQSGTTYGTWSGKTASSDAVYAGNSAGGNSSIQMRSDKSNSGIVTTNSGGYAKKVVVTWNSNTTSGRTLNIYGKNTAYSAATDLYDSANQGTLLGKIKMGTSTEFVIPGNYQYIGLRSADGAMYITEIQITWSSSPIALESIAVSGQKTDYYVGDSFVAPTVTATYSDGSSSVVSGAEFSGYDMSKEGEQTVTVSYTQGDVTKETIYTINVNARPALESIAIDGTPTTEYTVGGSFVAPSVKATYSDGLKQTVAAKFSGYDMSKEGEQTVTVSYTEGDITAETTYKIVVKAAPSGPVEKSATLSFANKAQRTSFSSTQQVWEQNGIKFTNDKSSSTTAVADYAAPVRLYANSKVTVEAPGNISKIVFDCNSSSYATAMKNSIGTVSGATVSVSSDKVTVTFTNANAASFVVAKLTAQVRMDSITVTYLQ